MPTRATPSIWRLVLPRVLRQQARGFCGISSGNPAEARQPHRITFSGLSISTRRNCQPDRLNDQVIPFVVCLSAVHLSPFLMVQL